MINKNRNISHFHTSMIFIKTYQRLIVKNKLKNIKKYFSVKFASPVQLFFQKIPARNGKTSVFLIFF